MIVVVAKLHRRLLGKSKQEIGEIKACVQARENKSSPRIAVGLGIDLDSPEITAPPKGMLPAVVDHVVRESPRLVAKQLRISIGQAPEMSERKIGKAPVKRIRGNTGNSQVASDVLVEGVQILGTNARAVEVIAVVECRCNEMEILGARTCSGHIRQREEVQQALRDRIDGQPGTLKIVSGNRLTGARIDKLHTYAGEVSATFGNCGHGRES